MEKILITGGAGFIGSHIAEIFSEKEYEIIVVDNLVTGQIKNIENIKNCTLYNLDIKDKDKLEEVFKEHEFKYVFHEAAQVSVSTSVKDPIYDANQNIIGILNLLELIKKYKTKKLLFASSAAVYGVPKKDVSEETDELEFLSPYGLTKFTSEEYIKLYNKLYNIDYIIFRYSNVFGPRQSSLGEAGVVSIFNDAMINDLAIYIEGDGEQTRDFIYVKDVAYANYICAIEDVKNELFNLSNNKKTSINELFSYMKKAHNYKKDAIYKEQRLGDIKDSRLDNKKLLKKTSFEPKYEVSEGLKEYADEMKG